MTCSSCAKFRETKTDRVPRGWKRMDVAVYCETCWTQAMVLRAVAVPVVAIEDGTWEEFRAALHAGWAAATACSNWFLSEMYARDVRRTGEQKMPRMAPLYLYPEARGLFPALPSQTVAALEHAVAAKYRAKRYDVVWRCASSLPTHRYPVPFPVPNQGWNVEIDGERPVVSLRLGERRWRLRLKGGARFHRQLTAIRELAGGQAVRGQLDLMERTVDGRSAVVCKMVAWLPRRHAGRKAEGTLFVRSTAASLLVALNAKDETLWTYNADHVRRWSAEHRAQLQRWSEDHKYEQRPVPSFAERRAQAADKYHRRMHSAVQEIATSLANYAGRRHFAAVRYDDTERGYCEGFPWFALRDRIAAKLDEVGIELIASGPAVTETPGALAEGDLS